MPYFDENQLDKLHNQASTPSASIDLANHSKKDALKELAQLIANQGPEESYNIYFSAAKGDGKTTLFQPLGKYLLSEKKAGNLKTFLPLSDGCGFYIAFKR